MTNILVTNDDGVDATGLLALAQVAENFGDVYIVAPKTNQSGKSQGITLNQKVEVERRAQRLFVVNGTPTDCTRLAYSEQLGFQVDWVLSGVNHGPNLSDDVLYSGTVGAAMEGRFTKHIPIAFSYCGPDEPQYSKLQAYIDRVLRVVATASWQPFVLNINFPEISTELATFRETRLHARHGVPKNSNPHSLPLGTSTSFNLPVPGADQFDDSPTDVNTIQRGQISVTPITHSQNEAGPNISKILESIEASELTEMNQR